MIAPPCTRPPASSTESTCKPPSNTSSSAVLTSAQSSTLSNCQTITRILYVCFAFIASAFTKPRAQVFFSPDGDDKYYPAVISIFAADEKSRVIVFDKSKPFVHKEECRTRPGGRGRGRGGQTPVKKSGRGPGRPKSKYSCILCYRISHPLATEEESATKWFRAVIDTETDEYDMYLPLGSEEEVTPLKKQKKVLLFSFILSSPIHYLCQEHDENDE